MKKNDTAIYRARLDAVRLWLRDCEWEASNEAYDYVPIYERAMREFNYQHRDRVIKLVQKAAGLERGEYVQVAGGAPRKTVAVPVDALTPEQREKYLN